VCRVVRVSGTIRKAEEEAILRAKRAVLALKEDGGGEDLLGSLLGPGGGGGRIVMRMRRAPGAVTRTSESWAYKWAYQYSTLGTRICALETYGRPSGWYKFSRMIRDLFGINIMSNFSTRVSISVRPGRRRLVVA
jgi:hypothetical protein